MEGLTIANREISLSFACMGRISTKELCMAEISGSELSLETSALLSE